MWKGWRYISGLGGLIQGCTSFPRILKPPQNCRDQKSDMKPVPCRGSTNIRRQCKKTQTPSDLAPGVYTPLDYFHTRAEQEIIFEYEEYSHVGTPQRKVQHAWRKGYSTTD